MTNCDGELKKILSKCVEVDPKKRYQNIDELQAALTKKNFSPLKICATILATLAGMFWFFNSTADKNIPAKIETEPDENISTEINNLPVENETAPAENILPKIKVQSDEIENSQVEKETPKIETPAPNSKLEKIQPMPPQTGIENFQPSFSNNEITLENFKPSFPAPPTFNPNSSD